MIGIDDANITLNYAENIAAGDGYVYYVGGERVEGSTSPAWTMISTLAFLLPGAAEIWLMLAGLCLTLLTLPFSVQLARQIFKAAGQSETTAIVLVLLWFICLPAFYGWTVWSLMDVTLVVFVITWATALSAHRFFSDGLSVWKLPFCMALLVAVRPEGIALALGLAALHFSANILLRDGKSVRLPYQMAGAAIVTWCLIAALRYAYFGDIFPNTYYAKVSTDRLSQLRLGLGYLSWFLRSPMNLALLLLAAGLLGFLITRLKGAKPLLLFWVFVMFMNAGGIALYTLMGGDHFGSFRFFLFLYPTFIPFAALTIALVWPPRLPKGVAVILSGVAVLIFWATFSKNLGGYEIEFRVAKEGRYIGYQLSQIPVEPSVGVIAAGGIAMAYEGVILDLMGLNWEEMAKTGRSNIGTIRNHGGFNRDVFYKHLPEIVHPRVGCDEDIYRNKPFYNTILKGLFSEEAFTARYDYQCWEGIQFFRRRPDP